MLLDPLLGPGHQPALTSGYAISVDFSAVRNPDELDAEWQPTTGAAQVRAMIADRLARSRLYSYEQADEVGQVLAGMPIELPERFAAPHNLRSGR
ncbi:hypothetical protein [Nocardia bovistercoris]|uniref:Uncharacterized protein n=1 Tax=Nocardia bovistercoris TaxID=2785916 RepID=A0A931N5Z4_9NOCA|nr:hypothetical protein [Nocardia bovistercoris]MBH0780394.1 hypothetical protein [Nocardia bovistercoris]